jgi:hypothetical protein
MPLDIQSALEQAYLDGRYMRRLRYEEPCEPLLTPDDQTWANECIARYRTAHPDWFALPQSVN